MTDPIIDRLDHIKGRADMATDGPWVAEYSGEQGNCVIPHDAESTREAVAVTRLFDQQADAEVAARTDVVQMEAALREVLDLHHRATDFFEPDDFCAECSSMYRVVPYPCRSRRAIADALGVETEGGEG